MELSKKLKQLKENVMLDIHEKAVPVSLEELKEHNTNIDKAIKELEKVENTNK